MNKNQLISAKEQIEVIYKNLNTYRCEKPIVYKLMESAIKLTAELKATLACIIEHDN